MCQVSRAGGLSVAKHARMHSSHKGLILNASVKGDRQRALSRQYCDSGRPAHAAYNIVRVRTVSRAGHA
jgi:hypothetical protein